MVAFTFDEFAEPDLQLTFRGVTYTCRPPTVEASTVILALHMRARARAQR
jgi:hypothetical protein